MTEAEIRETKSNKPHRLRSGLCILVAILGTAYSLWLKLYGLISTEAAFFGFTCLFIFIAIVVYVLPQLQELNLKELKVVLREIKESETRIYATEQTLRELMMAFADLAIMESLNVGRLAGSDLANLRRQWGDMRIDKILDLVRATPEQKNHLRRYVPLFKEMDDSHASTATAPLQEREAATAPFVKKLLDQFRSEIAKDKA